MNSFPIMFGAPTINSTNPYVYWPRWEKLELNAEQKRAINRFCFMNIKISTNKTNIFCYNENKMTPDIVNIELNTHDAGSDDFVDDPDSVFYRMEYSQQIERELWFGQQFYRSLGDDAQCTFRADDQLIQTISGRLFLQPGPEIHVSADFRTGRQYSVPLYRTVTGDGLSGYGTAVPVPDDMGIYDV